LAAQNAAGIFACSESIVLARRGLEMLKTLPESPEIIRQELNLQLTLGLSLATTRGCGLHRKSHRLTVGRRNYVSRPERVRSPTRLFMDCPFITCSELS